MDRIGRKQGIGETRPGVEYKYVLLAGIAADRYPGETFDRASEVYHRLSREYVEKAFLPTVELGDEVRESEKARLRVIGSKSLDHFFGHAAYEFGYEAHMTDVANNNDDVLRSLVEKTASEKDSDT